MFDLIAEKQEWKSYLESKTALAKDHHCMSLHILILYHIINVPLTSSYLLLPPFLHCLPYPVYLFSVYSFCLFIYIYFPITSTCPSLVLMVPMLLSFWPLCVLPAFVPTASIYSFPNSDAWKQEI